MTTEYKDLVIKLKDLTIESRKELERYFNIREIVSCEYNFNVLFMWADCYNTKYYVNDNYLVIYQQYKDNKYVLMPLCKEEHFEEAFEDIRDYFKLHDCKFQMYVTDKTFADFVNEKYNEEYLITANRDGFDYLYNGDDLRKLEGKKYRKKRNHLSAFYRDYEGRYEYRQLVKEDKDSMCEFVKRWREGKEDKLGKFDEELKGVCRIVENMDKLHVKIAGVFIDGRLEAFTIGTLINNNREVIIQVEKANDNIRGLYQFINQQFLINEFNDVELVNREDDSGIPGLRKSKESYYPIDLVKKYTIVDYKDNQN
jgi:hypothetical protein